MDRHQVSDQKNESIHIFWGIALPVLLFFPYLWISLVTRTVLDIPVPDPTPGYYDRNPIGMPASYWIYSVSSIFAFMSPGIVGLLFHNTRRAGVGWCVSAAVVGAGIWVLLAWFEFGGGWDTGD